MDIPGFLERVFGLADPQQLRAGITGLFQMTGVFVTGFVAIATWIGNQTFTRWRARRAREQKQRDIQTAILAEVDAILAQRRASGDYASLAESLRQRFAVAKEAGEDYTPYVTPETGDFIFEAVKQDISVLAEDEIGPVTRFYRQIRLIEDFAGELKVDRFYALDLDRKERMMLHYVLMLDEALTLGEEARRCLVASLEPNRHQ